MVALAAAALLVGGCDDDGRSGDGAETRPAPLPRGRSETAKISAGKVGLATIEMAIDTFEVECGRCPTTAEGLNALVAQPAELEAWRGPYLKAVPADPWRNAYVYRFPGQHNSDSYDLYSTGPDGNEGGGDDIDNWSDD